MKKGTKKYGFTVGKTYPAVITSVKNDRVLFSVTNHDGERFSGGFFIHGQRINLHQVFRTGTEIPVVISQICNPAKTRCRLHLLVQPVELPVDSFIVRHPVGSVTTAVINSVYGSSMTVILAPNVVCTAKRMPHGRTNMKVACKIDRYNADRKKLSVRVFLS